MSVNSEYKVEVIGARNIWELTEEVQEYLNKLCSQRAVIIDVQFMPEMMQKAPAFLMYCVVTYKTRCNWAEHNDEEDKQ